MMVGELSGGHRRDSILADAVEPSLPRSISTPVSLPAGCCPGSSLIALPVNKVGTPRPACRNGCGAAPCRCTPCSGGGHARFSGCTLASPAIAEGGAARGWPSRPRARAGIAESLAPAGTPSSRELEPIQIPTAAAAWPSSAAQRRQIHLVNALVGQDQHHLQPPQTTRHRLLGIARSRR
jgi:hypothetical protein